MAVEAFAGGAWYCTIDDVAADGTLGERYFDAAVLDVDYPATLRFAATQEGVLSASVNGVSIFSGPSDVALDGEFMQFGVSWTDECNATITARPQVDWAHVEITGGGCGTVVPSIDGWRLGSGPVLGGFFGGPALRREMRMAHGRR
jgi:hypothetical protein